MGAEVAHAGEAVHDSRPDTTDVGDVGAVDGVAVRVGDVEVERLVEVVPGELGVTDLARHDALHTCRQRRIAGRDRVVVVEVAALDVGCEVLAAQESWRARHRPA